MRQTNNRNTAANDYIKLKSDVPNVKILFK